MDAGDEFVTAHMFQFLDTVKVVQPGGSGVRGVRMRPGPMFELIGSCEPPASPPRQALVEALVKTGYLASERVASSSGFGVPLTVLARRERRNRVAHGGSGGLAADHRKQSGCPVNFDASRILNPYTKLPILIY